MSLHAPRYT